MVPTRKGISPIEWHTLLGMFTTLSIIGTMMTIQRIQEKFNDSAIQCICKSFPYPYLNIVVPRSNPYKIVSILMANRGAHMLLVGDFEKEYDVQGWKEMIELVMEIELRRNIKIEKILMNEYGLILWFENLGEAGKKRLEKAKAAFDSYDSWGDMKITTIV
jgi:hypothetical protein